MNRLMRIALVAVVCIAFACGDSDDDSEEGSKEVGIMWIGESGIAERVLKGFEARIEEKAPDLQIEYQTKLSDTSVALPIYQRYQEEKDAVVFLRSSGIKFMVEHPPAKPSFFGACNNPVALGAMEDMNAPDGNMTGVTYYIPAAERMEIFQQIFPDLESVGLLTEEGHPSSPIDRTETEAACEAAGIEYRGITCADEDALSRGVKSLVDEGVDIVIIGDQSLIIDNASIVREAAGTVPVVSYAEKAINTKDALCGFVPDDEKLGGMLADSLISVILEGKTVSEVPVKTDPEPRLLVNMEMMEELGVIIPDSLMKDAEKIE